MFWTIFLQSFGLILVIIIIGKAIDSALRALATKDPE